MDPSFPKVYPALPQKKLCSLDYCVFHKGIHRIFDRAVCAWSLSAIVSA